MASIAIMVGGALLNATAFIGGSYLAKALGGNSADKEKKRHDLALEKFNKDREACLESKEKLQSWLNEREKQAGHASDEFRSTDEALKYYNEMHSGTDDPEIMRAAHEPQFSDYYSPSSNQRGGEMLYVGGGMLALGYGISKFL